MNIAATRSCLCLVAWLVLAVPAPPAAAGPAEDLAAAEVAYGRGDFGQVLALIRPLADSGNATAQYNLGTMYSRGAGVPQDLAEAVRWYRKAADQGNVAAMHNLGAMYVTGRGAPQDFAEGARWLRNAADRGDPVAQYNLAVMHENGQGMPKDYVQAYKWYGVAAARFPNNPDKRKLTAESRDRVAGKLKPDQLARAKKLVKDWVPVGASTPSEGAAKPARVAPAK